MITRVWRGRTRPEHADEYGAFLKRTAYPDYGDVKGNLGWILLRRPGADAVDFLLVSFWDSPDALRRYAGDDPEQPHYYPEDRAALLEPLERAANFEVLDANLKW